MRILILDDEPAIREILRDGFQSMGYLVHEESNGADGLLTLGQFTFQFVVSDINMPSLDGIQFLKVVRPRFPMLPIIFVSGGSKYKHDEIMTLGASGVFEKLNLDCSEIQNLAALWKQGAETSFTPTTN